MASAAVPLLRMALRNVRKNWRHSLGTVGSIAVGFMAMGLFEGYLRSLMEKQGDGLSRRNMYGDVLIQKVGASSAEARQEPWKYRLDARDQAFLDAYLFRHADLVATRVRMLNLNGLATAGSSSAMFVGFGYDVAEGATMRREFAWNATAGKPLHLSAENAVMLGRGLGAALDCLPGGAEPHLGKDGLPIAKERPLACRQARVQLTTTTETGQLNVVEPEVAGLFSAGLKEYDGRVLSLPLPTVQRLLDTQALSLYSVDLKRREQVAGFVTELREAARNEGLGLEVARWQDHQIAELYRRGMQMLGIYRTFVVLVVVTIAGMSVLMTMMKAVSERTREIGALRSLGFLRRHVIGLFTLEAGLLAAASSLLGFAGTLAATALINASGITYRAGITSEDMLLQVAYVPGAYAFALVFLSLVALAAALLPARRAAHLSIPEALAHA